MKKSVLNKVKINSNQSTGNIINQALSQSEILVNSFASGRTCFNPYYGTSHNHFDYVTSEKLSELLKLDNLQSFQQLKHLVFQSETDTISDYIIAEGFVFIKGLLKPIIHTWFFDNAGSVVDPLLVSLNLTPDDIRYYSGHELPVSEFIKLENINQDDNEPLFEILTSAHNKADYAMTAALFECLADMVSAFNNEYHDLIDESLAGELINADPWAFSIRLSDAFELSAD